MVLSAAATRTATPTAALCDAARDLSDIRRAALRGNLTVDSNGRGNLTVDSDGRGSLTVDSDRRGSLTVDSDRSCSRTMAPRAGQKPALNGPVIRSGPGFGA